MIRAFALTALAALSWPAAASECANAQTQQQLNQCQQQAYAQADTRLNALYEQIIARLQDDPAATRDLRRAQRAWLAFRDAECRFASPAQGSAAGMALTQCLTRLTRQRTDDFQRYRQCQEGDLSCRLPRASAPAPTGQAPKSTPPLPRSAPTTPPR